MSSQKIKFGDKEVDKKKLFILKSYFVRFCRFEQNSYFQ